MKNIPVSALIGLFFTALYFLGAIFAPLLAPYGMAEVVGDVWEPSSADYWLGTDNIGRDLLSRMIYGGRTTIFIATMATVISFTTGAILGIFAAVSGGWVDQLLSRFVDLIMSIPTLIFALVVLSVTPVTVPMLILVMGLLDSTRVFRLARAVAVDIEVMDYVEAARLRGEKTAWIIFREILPNVWPPIIVETCIRLSYAVLLVVALSYLGLGAQPPAPDWGLMIAKERAFLVTGPWVVLAPAAAIVSLIIGVNLLGDGMREWLAARKTADE